MATVDLGTRQSSWATVATTDVSGALSDIGAYTYNASLPSTSTGAGRYVIALPNVGTSPALSDCCLQILFFIVSAGSGLSVNARIWGLSPGGSGSYIGTYLGDVVAGQGDTPGPVGANSTFCFWIRILNDRTLTPPGIRLPGSPSGTVGEIGAATMMLDAVGCSHIVVELRRSGGVSTDDVGFSWRSF